MFLYIAVRIGTTNSIIHNKSWGTGIRNGYTQLGNSHPVRPSVLCVFHCTIETYLPSLVNFFSHQVSCYLRMILGSLPIGKVD